MPRSTADAPGPAARAADQDVTGATTFGSILFETPRGPEQTLPDSAPECFPDLNLDQIVDTITAGYEQYDLKGFFYTPLTVPAEIAYRQEVFRDLESPVVHGAVTEFAAQFRQMRAHLDQMSKLHYRRQRQRWFLAATAAYCEAIVAFARDLAAAGPSSAGLQRFSSYLSAYHRSEPFTTLRQDTRAVLDELGRVRYCLLIKGKHIHVSRYEGEADYGTEVLAVFDKFKQGAAQSYLIDYTTSVAMDHVEAAVLDLVAKLFPQAFADLDEYCNAHGDHLDQTVAAFDREIQLYLSYLDYLAPMRAAGLPFCYPEVSGISKDVCAQDTFDLALSRKLVGDGRTVIRNDFSLHDGERIIVVSGPNQGGKTTFARTFGQLHHLGSLGLPVPGSAASLFLFDELLTHFEKQEDITTGSGKLQDDLVRMRDLLGRATARSVIILNEMFSSTSLEDSLLLGNRVLEEVISLDAVCVCITFVDELSRLGPTTVSMVSTVVPDDPATRTYRVVRRPADGLAYAQAIADKYGLGYETVIRRVAR